ncbi:GntR family transcriptional regulator [Mesorhizobium sp. M0991]|uniref:GntR family transcriptional regulator n=1 Tax=Mesorhizobium sp. M0991 TaxID=2957043 RepID=UPI00333D10B0
MDESGPTLEPLFDFEHMPSSLSPTSSTRPYAKLNVLTERTYARLKCALILGQLAPGERFTVRMLAQRFGTSITPVRNALSQLAAAEALHQNRRSGIIVPLLNQPELDEMLKLRLALEGLAFSIATPRYRTSDWREFKALHADICNASQRDYPVVFAAAVWALRLAILKLDQASLLAMDVSRIWCRVGPTFTQMAADMNRRRCITRHLERMIEAIGNRNYEKARSCVVDEITVGMAPPTYAAASPTVLRPHPASSSENDRNNLLAS